MTILNRTTSFVKPLIGKSNSLLNVRHALLTGFTGSRLEIQCYLQRLAMFAQIEVCFCMLSVISCRVARRLCPLVTT